MDGTLAMRLRVEGVDAWYGTSKVLHGVSLEVNSGEVVTLLGRNGAGKSTTLKVIAGLIRPTRGRIWFDAIDMTRAAPHTRARNGLGYVPQERLVFATLSVEENLRAVARRSFESWRWLFELFPSLGARLRQRAGTLSGGEQEMLAIARALVTEPTVILMDEPSTGLMPSMLQHLADVVRDLRDRGVGVLVVEEKVPFAMHVASRAYILEAGQIVFEGDMDRLNEGDVLVRHLGVRA